MNAVSGMLVMMAGAALCGPHALADSWCGDGVAAIPDDGQSVRAWSVDVAVPADHLAVSASVVVDVSHPWVGDLEITVFSPSGVAVTLLDRPGMPDGGWIGPWGCGGDNLNVRFDDGAANTAEETCSQWDVPVIGGVKRPLQGLSLLYGVPASGAWRLDFLDHSPIDAGMVNAVCIDLETSPDCNTNGIPDVDDIAGGGSDDSDGDGVPDECQCQADFDGDGLVDVNDILILIGQFGSPGTADLDGDGVVDSDDLLLVLASWGAC